MTLVAPVIGVFPTHRIPTPRSRQSCAALGATNQAAQGEVWVALFVGRKSRLLAFQHQLDIVERERVNDGLVLALYYAIPAFRPQLSNVDRIPQSVQERVQAKFVSLTRTHTHVGEQTESLSWGLSACCHHFKSLSYELCALWVRNDIRFTLGRPRTQIAQWGLTHVPAILKRRFHALLSLLRVLVGEILCLAQFVASGRSSCRRPAINTWVVCCDGIDPHCVQPVERSQSPARMSSKPGVVKEHKVDAAVSRQVFHHRAERWPLYIFPTRYSSICEGLLYLPAATSTKLSTVLFLRLQPIRISGLFIRTYSQVQHHRAAFRVPPLDCAFLHFCCPLRVRPYAAIERSARSLSASARFDEIRISANTETSCSSCLCGSDCCPANKGFVACPLWATAAVSKPSLVRSQVLGDKTRRHFQKYSKNFCDSTAYCLVQLRPTVTCFAVRRLGQQHGTVRLWHCEAAGVVRHHHAAYRHVLRCMDSSRRCPFRRVCKLQVPRRDEADGTMSKGSIVQAACEFVCVRFKLKVDKATHYGVMASVESTTNLLSTGLFLWKRKLKRTTSKRSKNGYRFGATPVSRINSLRKQPKLFQKRPFMEHCV